MDNYTFDIACKLALDIAYGGYKNQQENIHLIREMPIKQEVVETSEVVETCPPPPPAPTPETEKKCNPKKRKKTVSVILLLKLHRKNRNARKRRCDFCVNYNNSQNI